MPLAFLHRLVVLYCTMVCISGTVFPSWQNKCFAACEILVRGGGFLFCLTALLPKRCHWSWQAGFEYATYNDPEDLKRVVKRINRRGKIRSLFGRPRRAVAAIMMEALQVRGGTRLVPIAYVLVLTAVQNTN